MIVRSNELNILQKLLERGAKISDIDRRAIARHGALFTTAKIDKEWAEIIKQFPHKLITTIIIPETTDEENSLWKVTAYSYLVSHNLYYNIENYSKTVTSQDLIDIAFHEYPEVYDVETHCAERETFQDLTGFTTVIHLGKERNNKLFPEIANNLCTQFRSSQLSKCLLWIYEGTRAEYQQRYSEIEVDQIIEIGRNTAPGKVVEAKKNKDVVIEKKANYYDDAIWGY